MLVCDIASRNIFYFKFFCYYYQHNSGNKYNVLKDSIFLYFYLNLRVYICPYKIRGNMAIHIFSVFIRVFLVGIWSARQLIVL